MKLKNKKTVIYIIAALILIIIVGSLVIINKENRKEETTKESNEIETTSDYLSTVSYLKLNTLPDDYYGYFYKKEKVTLNNIDNKIKLYMAIRKVITDKKINANNSKIEIATSDVEKTLKVLFGDKVEYKHESLNGNTCSYTAFKYDKSSKSYIQESDDCVEPRTDTIISEIIDTTEENNYLKITEKVAFVETSYNLETKKIVYNIYKDINKTEKVATVDSYTIESCKDLLNSYQYTFKKDSNNYYLETVEIIK